MQPFKNQILVKQHEILLILLPSVWLDFPGGPVVKTSPSNEGGAVPSLVGKLRSHMPLGQKPKTQNRSNIVTNSIKTLKMAHTKKKQKPKKILAEIFNCND